MIDTLIINVPGNKVRVISDKKWNLIARQDSFSKFANNPTKQQKDSGKYYPRLTAVQRIGCEQIIKIEFSIPKLLYLNNLDEVENGDFIAVVQTLSERLAEMGIAIPREVLKYAEVSTVHYSKNIILRSGYTARHVISELQRINLNKMQDLTKTRFMNSGESLQGYSISNSFVFYDKISDLKKDDKRAIDSNQSLQQRSLFSELQNEEVLRFEVRLSQKRKLNSVFQQLGINKNPIFLEVFSEENAVRVLMKYWNEKIDNNKYVLFTYSESAEAVFKKICIARQGSRPQGLLSLLGLLTFAKESNGGLRELREILSTRITNRAWYDIIKNLKAISNDLENLSELDWYREVSSQLINYKPYKIRGN